MAKTIDEIRELLNSETFLKGQRDKHIVIDGSTIKYNCCKSSIKPRNLLNPEESVQAWTFLVLIYNYNYKASRIKMYEPVKMGSETKEADIIVYNDDECTEPHILVECKRADVSEPEYQQAIDQAYSYAYALPNDVKYIWVTSSIRNQYLRVDKNRQTKTTESDIPQFGVEKLASYKYVYDAENLDVKDGEQQFTALSIIGQDELTKRFKKAHATLWGGGQLNPSEAFDELDKLIFCKIWDERKDRSPGDPYDFQIITVDESEISGYNKLGEVELQRAKENLENSRLAERIFKLYEEGRKKDPEVFRDNIRLTAEKIRTVVGYLESVNLGDTDLDSKGRAFETFMDSFFRGSFGQYFTPRPIVKFITDVLPIKNSSFVLDSSCGSGGFLLYALDKVRKEADRLYPNYKSDVKQYQKHFKYWHDFAEKNLYGIEINEQISRAAKMNMIIHDDGHTNVITSDGLISPEEITKITDNKGFKYDHFDFVITNPPFGSVVKQRERAYIKEYKLGFKESDWLSSNPNAAPAVKDSQSTEVLFIEQAYKFLKEGGYLGIVIPDGILTNSSLQYVRNNIEEWFRIVAVVSMPQTAFMATGAGVKSSVLILKKWTKEQTAEITKQKEKLKQTILEENLFTKRLAELDKEKKKIIKDWTGFVNDSEETDKKVVEKSDAFKAWKADIMADYSQRANDIKDELVEIYQTKKAQTLADYPIFMAIAEDIGYDATGKGTGTNELEFIGGELVKFIKTL